MNQLLLGLALCVQGIGVLGQGWYSSEQDYKNRKEHWHIGYKVCQKYKSSIVCEKCYDSENGFYCSKCNKKYHKKVYSKIVEDNFQLYLSGKYEPWKDIKIDWSLVGD